MLHYHFEILVWVVFKNRNFKIEKSSQIKHFTPTRTIFASGTLLAMLVDNLQSVVNKNWQLCGDMNDLNSFNAFQDCNRNWFIQLNCYTYGILDKSINKHNIYSKKFTFQTITQNNKWKNHCICDEFNLLAVLINCQHIINYLSIFQRGFNDDLFILVNLFCWTYIFRIFSHGAILYIFSDANNLFFIFLLACIFDKISMLIHNSRINFYISSYTLMGGGMDYSKFSFGFNSLLYVSQYSWQRRLWLELISIYCIMQRLT